MNSHLLPLFISYRSSGVKLIKYQANSSCVIIFVILVNTLFYKTLILQGEIWCWSLLGLKGLNGLKKRQNCVCIFCQWLLVENNRWLIKISRKPSPRYEYKRKFQFYDIYSAFRGIWCMIKYHRISNYMHSNFQGVIITPLVGLIYSLQWSYFLGSYFNSKKEFKELLFRSKNDPRYWGVKITPKKELSCT